MALNGLLESIINDAREQGRNPALVTMSPDVYAEWQKRLRDVESFMVSGLPIEIRDNYKPRTILLLGPKSTDGSRHDLPKLPSYDCPSLRAQIDEWIIKNPACFLVSPDMYSMWQKQRGGSEPIRVGTYPIQIRDDYGPGTLLISPLRAEDSIIPDEIDPDLLRLRSLLSDF